MATKQSMLTNITAFIDRIITAFSRTRASKDQVLYINNNEGVFSFKPEFAVSIAQVGSTANEVAAAKAAIIANYPNGGTTLINSYTRQVEELDWDTKTWSATSANYFTHIRQRRVYYSPWSRRLWVADNYGDLRRFMSNGMTQIG